MLIKLWVLCACMAMSLATFEIRQLLLNGNTYQGFIYPYVITFNPSQKKLQLTKVTSSPLLLGTPTAPFALWPGYDLLPDTSSIPLDNISQLRISSSSIKLRNSTQIDGRLYLLLRSPHTYLFRKFKGENTGYYRAMFEFQSEQLFRQVTKKYKIDDLFKLQVEELGREYMYVYMFHDAETFTLFLKRKVPSDINDIQTYRFRNEFFFVDGIGELLLIRNTWKEVLNIVLYGNSSYCQFHATKQLEMSFKGCHTFKGTKIKSIIALQHDYMMIHTSDAPNPNTTNAPTPNTIQETITITSFSKQPIQHCSFSYTNQPNQTLIYTGVLQNYVVACTVRQCSFYDNKCQAVREDIDVKSWEGIEKVDLMRFRVHLSTDMAGLGLLNKAERYVSQLLIKAKKVAVTIPFCVQGEVMEPMKIVSGETIPGQYYCTVVEKHTQQTACDNLTCYACSLTPFCYFIDNRCQRQVDSPIALFPESTYRNPNRFLQVYSRYLYGQTSQCPAASFNCQLNKSSIQTSITIQQKSQPQLSQYCVLFMSQDKESYYRRENPQNFNFSIKQFKNPSYEHHDFGDDFLVTRDDGMGGHYLLMYIFRNSNDSSTELDRMLETYLLINREQEQIYNATKLFTIVFGSFLLVTVIFIAFVLLKNKILARLALWGVITFTPSGVYPLSEIELKLKIRDLTKKSFLMEYRYEPKESSKEGTFEECSFCLEEFFRDDLVFQIYCRHKYHKSCLSDWIKKQRNSQKCPICKRGFTEAQLLRFNQNSYSYGLKQDVPNL